MVNTLFISNATIVNEHQQYVADLLIEDDIISEIGNLKPPKGANTIDARGKFLLPGIIDTHVHFREPGLISKGSIRSESAAAVAGGVTSYFDMPNTIPNATTRAAVNDKFRLAHRNSFANYSFYIGIQEHYLDEVFNADYSRIPAITDDGLYFTNTKSLLVDQPDLFRKLLNESGQIVAIHSEYESVIEENLRQVLCETGGRPEAGHHPLIRSERACLEATKAAMAIGKQTGGRLHILHLSTAKEAEMLDKGIPLNNKRITAEVCVHHLWFSDEDYQKLGARIKWNPAIKTKRDRSELWNALLDDRIDIIGSDHAPHLSSEKQLGYLHSPGGAPMVQHTLVAMMEFVKSGRISLETVVEKMCHNPATLFGISRRGFIREGYYADIVLVSPDDPWEVNSSNVLYRCGWSPFEGSVFASRVHSTVVNGTVVYADGKITGAPNGMALRFGNR
jgi:dihydroorotase